MFYWQMIIENLNDQSTIAKAWNPESIAATA
jgi:hypothetical protein